MQQSADSSFPLHYIVEMLSTVSVHWRRDILHAAEGINNCTYDPIVGIEVRPTMVQASPDLSNIRGSRLSATTISGLSNGHY